MIVDKKKLELARARACMGLNVIVSSGFPIGSYCGFLRCYVVKPESMGKLAKILGVDVTEIIKEEN